MKVKAVIVLISVMIGIVVPPSLPLMTAAGLEASIGTLDVCHDASPALFSHGDAPCMNECPCPSLPLASTAVPDFLSSVFIPLLLPLQFEHPPQF